MNSKSFYEMVGIELSSIDAWKQWISQRLEDEASRPVLEWIQDVLCHRQQTIEELLARLQKIRAHTSDSSTSVFYPTIEMPFIPLFIVKNESPSCTSSSSSTEQKQTHYELIPVHMKILNKNMCVSEPIRAPFNEWNAARPKQIDQQAKKMWFDYVFQMKRSRPSTTSPWKHIYQPFPIQSDIPATPESLPDPTCMKSLIEIARQRLVPSDLGLFEAQLSSPRVVSSQGYRGGAGRPFSHLFQPQCKSQQRLCKKYQRCSHS